MQRKIDSLVHEIKAIDTQLYEYKRFSKLEFIVKNAIIEKLNERVFLFKTNATKMKAILRIPRLSK